MNTLSESGKKQIMIQNFYFQLQQLQINKLHFTLKRSINHNKLNKILKWYGVKVNLHRVEN